MARNYVVFEFIKKLMHTNHDISTHVNGCGNNSKVMSNGFSNYEKTVCEKKSTLTDRHADMNTRTHTQCKYSQAQHLRSHFGFSTSCALDWATLASTSFTASKKH